jgi:serine/threonine-protein kinase
VGYFLLTGTPPFRGSLAEFLWKQVREDPEPPSVRLGAEVSGDLEGLILKCLYQRREVRPADIRALIVALLECRSAGTWTVADAESWWRANGPREDEGAPVPAVVGAVDTTVTGDLSWRDDMESPRASREHGGSRGER